MLLANKDTAERTPPQLPGGGVYTHSYDSTLYHINQHYVTYQAMRQDATIAFARMLCVAPLVNTGWAYEGEHAAFIKPLMELFRIQLIKQIIEGYIDFGWAGFEVVWDVVDGSIVPVKIKNLIQQQTDIIIDPKTGAYRGLKQDQIMLFDYETLRITIDLVGTDWYGRPLLENSRLAYLSSLNVSAAADKYDKKVAGSHWVIHYPIGTSPYGPSKLETDNYAIAIEMLQTLTYSGQFVVPRRIATFIDDINKNFGEDQWKIELITDQGRSSSSFIERQKYLDTLKVRGLGFPERAILEGQFGTKAESETHANIAVTNFEMRQQIMCQQINEQLINYITQFNFGAINTDKIIPMPLANFKTNYWQKIYSEFLKTQAQTEYDALDMSTMRKNLDLPENATTTTATSTD